MKSYEVWPSMAQELESVFCLLPVFFFQVREAEKMLADSQKRFEYIQSLQDTVCMNYRNLSEHEVAVKVKVSIQPSIIAYFSFICYFRARCHILIPDLSQ